MPKKIIFVLGMHRSGTSAVTRTLNLLGAALPPNLLQATKSNSLGHWEPFESMVIHELFLHSLRMRWDDPRPLPDRFEALPEARRARERIAAFLTENLPDAPIIVLKDPRLCRLLPLWKDTPFREPGLEPFAALVMRHPLEVAESLRLRDSIDTSSAMLLWLRHVLDAERWSRGYPRAVVSYDALLADWRGEIARLSSAFGLGWPAPTAAQAFAVEEFLSEKHRHHRRDAGDKGEADMPPLVLRCYRRIKDFALDDPKTREELDSIHAELESGDRMFGSWSPPPRTFARPVQGRRGSEDERGERVDRRSVLFITLDSCRFDTFAAAHAPNLKAVGPLHRAKAPSHFTYGSHAAFFVGFTPGLPGVKRAYLNPKFAKFFRVANRGREAVSPAAFDLDGRTIVDGFRRAGYRTIGSGAVPWFDAERPAGTLLTMDFDRFFYPGDLASVKRQAAWLDTEIDAAGDAPVFAFLNVGETHVPYWHEGASWSADDNPCRPFQEIDRAAECAERQRACLEYVDRALGDLLARFSHATVIVTADHGDCWGEDGLWEHAVSHKATLTVPLVFKVERLIDADRTRRHVVGAALRHARSTSADMPDADSEILIERNPKVIWSRVDDEILGMHGTSGEAFCLNATAGIAWEFLDRPRRESEICAHLRERFDIDDAACRESVAELVDSWRAADLINDTLISAPLQAAPDAPPLTASSVVSLRKDIDVSEINGEVIILDAANEIYHAAGATGSRILALLDAERPVREIVAKLRGVYDIDEATCTDEVLAFLATLRDRRLLDIAA